VKLRRKHYITLVVAGAAHFANIASYGADAPTKRAATQSKPDVQFLEYLGALEEKDGNWTDVAKSDLVSAATPAASDANDAAKSSSPIKKTVKNSEAVSCETEGK
jgi:hypothetical protein